MLLSFKDKTWKDFWFGLLAIPPIEIQSYHKKIYNFKETDYAAAKKQSKQAAYITWWNSDCKRLIIIITKTQILGLKRYLLGIPT